MVAKELIAHQFPFLEPSTSIIEALTSMEEEKVAHLPLLKNGAFEGLLSEDSLLDAPNADASIADNKLIPVGLFAYQNMHLFDLLGLFSKHKLTVLPVLNQTNNAFEGVIKLQDLVSQIISIGSFDEPGSIIVLSVETFNYSLSEISRIVESNDAKILSLFVNSNSEENRLEITIKINRLDNRAVLQTFNRYNYTVVASFQNAEYNDPATDRFESLMRYLNT
ncbi:MAG: CBS domain-containing protein [Luteibaculaceae bacterium]